jgi:predicted ATP-grasp superfamily ATP-dependent carboligase
VSQARLHTYQPLELKDALVVVAFPTTGSAGPIAGHYLQRNLSLPLVGDIVLPGLSNLTAIENGVATSPVRVSGGEVECNLDGSCPRVYLVLTEMNLPPPMLHDVAAVVLETARKGGARVVLSLEAVIRAEGDHDPDVFAAASDAKTLKEIAGVAKVEPAGRALLAGMAAELLGLGRATGFPTATLMVEARRHHPDGRAAAALIERVDHLIPHVHVDAKPLLAEAMDLEREISAAQEAAEAQVPRGPQTTFI